uniref:Core domain-containing protein n=1 Tax=Rhizochromulina marina TaxID=1034831 RepID=A0A7S2RUW2_9STRA
MAGRGSARALLAAARGRCGPVPSPALPLLCRYLSTASLEDIVVTKSCARRILELQKESSSEYVKLRLTVEGGGCSGFQYQFHMDSEPVDEEEDSVFERDGASVVIDEASLEFVTGATVDFVEEMIRSSFVVVNNPNSESACGCGSSFALKAFSDNPAVD